MPTRKTAGLGILVLFVFTSFLNADPPADEESIIDDKFILSEEYILSDKFQEFMQSDEFHEFLMSEELDIEDEDAFLDEEYMLGEDMPLDDEYLLSEDTLEDEDTLFDDEYMISEGTLNNEDTLLDDEYLISEDTLNNEGTLFDDEYMISENTLNDEDTLLDDESLLSDGSLVFEASSLIFEVPEFIYEPRSFDEIFPGFSRRQKTFVFSNAGLKYSFDKSSSPSLIPHPDSGIDILSSVMTKNPSHIVEALVVVPYNERELDMLDLYNALGRISDIQGCPIPWNGGDYVIFTESTRLESAKNRKSIPDPPPADMLPYSETVYLRLKEIHMGNLFIRGDISMSLYGITYSMTNFADVRFLLLPLMKAERFSAVLYLEPIKEGVLIYSMSGFYLPGFIADRVNLTPSINNRIAVFVKWITDGLRKQESAMIRRENEALGRQ